MRLRALWSALAGFAFGVWLFNLGVPVLVAIVWSILAAAALSASLSADHRRSSGWRDPGE